MGFRDILRKGSGLDLVTDSGENGEEDSRPSGVGIKQSRAKVKATPKVNRTDEKMLKQLEFEVSRAIEKLEDIRDKLRVRRGF